MGKDCRCEGEMTLGPWGYTSKNEWSYRPKHGIKQIIITYDTGIIESIMFKGVGDGDYSKNFAPKDGNNNPTVKKIDVDFPSEYLTGMSGTYGNISSEYGVCSLNFHTNKNQYGPFGTESVVKSSSTKTNPFYANANGSVITGFHGYWFPPDLYAIGIYVVPACSLSTEFGIKQNSHISSCSTGGLPRCLPPPGSAVAIGGNGGREWDDGVFAAVKGAHLRVRVDTDVLSAVQFSYTKNNGSDVVSPFHGGDCGGDMHKKTILFSEKGEYLIGIEGFLGVVGGIGDLDDYNNVVKSLTFITNKTRYGPVGTEIGTYFTSMKFGGYNGKVVGFHGRSGAYLHSIGLHSDYNFMDNSSAVKNKVKEED